MTCCSSGKARVYYNIPSKSGLKYKLKGSTKWQTIFANELLTFSCIKFSGTTITWTCPLDLENGFGGQSGSYTHPVPISFLGVQGGFQVSNWIINCQTISNPIESVNIPSTCERNGDPPININFTENVKYKFTITGTETGTKYLEIEVDECPDVQTIPCKFDPAKEQYIDVEMIPYTELPVNLPKYPLFQDCIEITSVGNLVVIEKVTTRNYGPPGDDDPSVRETRKTIKVLESPKGCPPPKARVECCPKGICGEDKKCPKGTTCELVCNGFKCCYRNGKLIRSIKL